MFGSSLHPTYSRRIAIAILSELHTSPYGRGITSHFDSAANALFICLNANIALPPENIIWIAHHGEFSSYDAVGQDSLTRVDLKWTEEKFKDDLSDELLNYDEITARLGTIELEPVFTVINEIN